MSAGLPPAASAAAFRFSQTWRVCASMSPMPAIEPSARRAVMPEMNSIRPRASIAVAWENCPIGVRNFSEAICCLCMAILVSFLRLENSSARNPEARAEPLELRCGIDGNRAAVLVRLPGAPSRFARAEKLRDTGGACSLADVPGAGFDRGGEPRQRAKPRDLDRQEEMGAAIGFGGIAVERPHRVTDGALGQATAEEIDHEGKTKALRAARPQRASAAAYWTCRCRSALARRSLSPSVPPFRNESRCARRRRRAHAPAP